MSYWVRISIVLLIGSCCSARIVLSERKSYIFCCHVSFMLLFSLKLSVLSRFLFLCTISFQCSLKHICQENSSPPCKMLTFSILSKSHLANSVISKRLICHDMFSLFLMFYKLNFEDGVCSKLKQCEICCIMTEWKKKRDPGINRSRR